MIVHGFAASPTRHEVAPLKEPLFIKLRDVVIFKDDPSLVLNDGVTVNEIELSPVCISVSLLGSPSDPVKAEM